MRELIRSLRNPDLYDHPVERFDLLETHASWVLLTGRYAYKIKKPVDFGFLDFSSLEKRRHFCEEELRLNRRLAPDLYLGVVAITGSEVRPALGGSGQVIEYAVKMRQFPQSALMSEVVAGGGLGESHVDAMASAIAELHQRALVADSADSFGRPERIRHWVIENFAHIRPLLGDGHRHGRLDILETWCEEEFGRRRALLQQRKRDGSVRECHGDLHLRNLALIDGRIRPFDCIEFNDELRWIDVMSELAFLVMDLQERGLWGPARRLLNRYLEHTGDYCGLRIFRYYLVYRALVRAKVAVLRLGGGGASEEERAGTWKEYDQYVELAIGYTRPGKSALIITHGLSGSGKSTFAAALTERADCVRVRSDVERKRLFGLRSADDSRSSLETGIYGAEATERTYDRLEQAARCIIDGGYSAVVDATFLRARWRAAFANLGKALGAPFLILDLRAPVSLLRARVLNRARLADDASEAGLEVLDHQLVSREPLGADELTQTMSVEADRPPNAEVLAQAVSRRLGLEWGAG